MIVPMKEKQNVIQNVAGYIVQSLDILLKEANGPPETGKVEKFVHLSEDPINCSTFQDPSNIL